MARRKVRRVKKRKRKSTEPQLDSSRPETEVDSNNTTASTRRYESEEEMLRDEYAYVLDDLRKMAIIAVGMFLLLILLGLVL
jgi:transposase